MDIFIILTTDRRESKFHACISVYRRLSKNITSKLNQKEADASTMLTPLESSVSLHMDARQTASLLWIPHIHPATPLKPSPRQDVWVWLDRSVSLFWTLAPPGSWHLCRRSTRVHSAVPQAGQTTAEHLHLCQLSTTPSSRSHQNIVGTLLW